MELENCSANKLQHSFVSVFVSAFSGFVLSAFSDFVFASAFLLSAYSYLLCFLSTSGLISFCFWSRYLLLVWFLSASGVLVWFHSASGPVSGFTEVRVNRFFGNGPTDLTNDPMN